MSRRALITGVAGQDGSYLAELLLAKGYEVYGVVGPDPGHCKEWAGELGERMRLVQGDLRDASSLSRLVADVMPDEVYNLAAISSVADSWDHPSLVIDVNAAGVARLLEALQAHAPHARFCQATSAEIFGHSEGEPQNESSEIRPVTPYGSAKACAHFLVQNQRDARDFFGCNAILYNHESPRRPVSFVTRKITDAAARIYLGLQSELRLGNLDSARDWGFAGDYVEGMWLMLQHDEPGDYVLATGMAHTVRDFCAAAFSHLNLDWQDHVIVDPEFFRPVDRLAPVGDSSKARAVLGWQPKKTFDELVADMVDSDVAQVRARSGAGITADGGTE